MRVDKDYSGLRVGVLTIIGPSHRANGYIIWDARCECGRTRKTGSNHMFRKGRYRKCTCDRKSKRHVGWDGNRRNCRECNKSLPANRYFRHDFCMQKETPYGEKEYGSYCQYGRGY